MRRSRMTISRKKREQKLGEYIIEMRRKKAKAK